MVALGAQARSQAPGGGPLADLAKTPTLVPPLILITLSSYETAIPYSEKMMVEVKR